MCLSKNVCLNNFIDLKGVLLWVANKNYLLLPLENALSPTAFNSFLNNDSSTYTRRTRSVELRTDCWMTKVINIPAPCKLMNNFDIFIFARMPFFGCAEGAAARKYLSRTVLIMLPHKEGVSAKYDMSLWNDPNIGKAIIPSSHKYHTQGHNNQRCRVQVVSLQASISLSLTQGPTLPSTP